MPVYVKITAARLSSGTVPLVSPPRLGLRLRIGLFGGLTLGLDRGGRCFHSALYPAGAIGIRGFLPFRYIPFLEYATTPLFLERKLGAQRSRSVRRILYCPHLRLHKEPF
jgi:hypothetical protein